MKLVIRHLPPDLPEPVFWSTVDPLLPLDHATTSFRRYDAGRLRKDRGKENSASRAYVDLPDEAACVAFAKAYNGHVFENKQGQRSQALVDYAPFPKVPTPAARRKPDPRQGSIEEDNDYLAFLERLSKGEDPVVPPTAPVQTGSTPLLDHIRKQRTAKSEKASAKASTSGHADAPKALLKPSAAGPPPTASTSTPPRFSGPVASTSTAKPAPTASAQASDANESAERKKRPSKRGGRGRDREQQPRQAPPEPRPPASVAIASPSPATPTASDRPIPAPQPKAAQPAQPASATSASTSSAPANPDQPGPAPKSRPPRGPTNDAHKRLLGGMLGGGNPGGGGGGRLAARRAAEKAAQGQAKLEGGAGPPPEASGESARNEASIARSGGRGRGARGRGRGAAPPAEG